MVNTTKRNTTLQQLLRTRNGPGAAVILQPHPQSPQHPRLTRIFVKIDPQNREQRKFWQQRLVRLKYHNPSLPITVLRRIGDAKGQKSTMSRVVLFWESERKDVLVALAKNSQTVAEKVEGVDWNPKTVLRWQSANSVEDLEEKEERQRKDSALEVDEMEEEEEDEYEEDIGEVDEFTNSQSLQASSNAESSIPKEANTAKPSHKASDLARSADRTIQPSTAKASKTLDPGLPKISDQKYTDFVKRLDRITISTTSQSTTNSPLPPSTTAPTPATYRARTLLPIPPRMYYTTLWTQLSALLPHAPIAESAADSASRLISEEKAREASANRVRTRAANDIRKREEDALKRAKEEAARSVAEAI